VKIHKQPKYALVLLSRLLGASAVLVLLAGAGVSWRQRIDNQKTEYNPSEAAPDSTTAAPSTDKPKDDAFKNYQAAPDAPRYLFIPKISVRAMIKTLGLTAAKQIESPRNVFDAGWYSNSAKPGQPGAMLVAGHISSWDTRGIFYELGKLTSGDELTIERGDGQTLAYKVIGSQTYNADQVDMAAALTPVTPDKPGLNLISCTGKVIKGTNDFDKRIVVFTEQL
jgi:sortase (surface protein transpeptidase)